VGLAGIPPVDGLALNALSWLFAPVARDDRPVQDHVREPLVLGLPQGIAQVRGLVCQHADDLFEVTVSGGTGDAMVAGQRVSASAVAEPPQPQHGLPEAGQRPAAARGAAPPPLREQQHRKVLRQFPGNVERGTVADHVDPFWQKKILW
jgi:hypothetical protein